MPIRQISTVAFVLLIVTASSASAQTGWCASIDKTQVGSLLGGAAPTPMQKGPAMDRATGGITTMCMFTEGQKALVAIRVQFASAAEAQRRTTIEFLKSQQKKEEATFVEEKSPAGDRAFWGVSEDGAFYSILKGATLAVVVFGDDDGKQSAAQKPALVKLATSLVSN